MQPIATPPPLSGVAQCFARTVMFSSDNPKMALPPLRGELKECILWSNAAELYRLEGAVR